MESVSSLGEIFINGEIVNLQSSSIINLQRKIEEIDVEQKDVKNKIFSIIETF